MRDLITDGNMRYLIVIIKINNQSNLNCIVKFDDKDISLIQHALK
jgi:hypothetical protein